jgi:hypothetical protein
MSHAGGMFPARHSLFAILFFVLTSCGTTLEDVRPTSRARQSLIIPRQPNRAPIPITEGELRAFMWRTLPALRLPKPTGGLPRHFRLLPALGEPLDFSMQLMVKQYVDSCQRRGRDYDCAGALLDGSTLDNSGKYKIAFDFAMGARWDGFTDELRQMANPTIIRVVLLSAMVAYMAMIVFPGIVTQAFAAAATVVLTAYLGAQTVWNLVFGWIQMVREADAAKTFDELRAAGERYGRLIGAQTARILVMVMTAVIAEGGIVARVLDLPKAAQASAALAAETGGMLGLAGVGQVSGVAVAASGVTVVLAPAAEAAQQVVWAWRWRGGGRRVPRATRAAKMARSGITSPLSRTASRLSAEDRGRLGSRTCSIKRA